MQESCCETSIRLNESVSGTAVAGVTHWLLVEVSSEWTPKPLQAPALSEAVRAHLVDALAAIPGSRLQLIRRPGQASGVRVFAAIVGRGIVSRTLSDVDAITALNIPALFQGEGEPVEGRMTLVCTHGIRDVCCAKEGAPVFRALQHTGLDHVWQTTHLGGHRFAATLVVLPAGIQFGRVTADEVPALVSSLERDELYRLDRYRGCTALPREAQVVEAYLREKKGLKALDALEWQGVEHDQHCFVVDGQVNRAQVRANTNTTARKVSCASDALKRPPSYAVSSSA